jgi:hypothetical protein
MSPLSYQETFDLYYKISLCLFESNDMESIEMNLTEYELADLALSAQASATPTTALFVTIMSGYLIVAWMVGEKLTRAQVIFINAIFIFFQLSLAAAWSMRWIVSQRYSNALHSIDPAFYDLNNPALLIAFPIVMCATVPGCLKFLWNVRHPKTK